MILSVTDMLSIVDMQNDFCVGFSVLDARKLDFEAFLIEDACRAIDLMGSLEAIKKNVQESGVLTITSDML